MLAVAKQARTLDQLERIIERGMEAWQEVSDALTDIQEGRLYHQSGYNTFDDYLRERWPRLKRRQIYNYIAAGMVAENVQSIAHSALSLTQAIRLAPLPIEQQREIAERVDFANTTVRELRAIVQDVQQKPHVSYNCGNNEWYTPAEYIEAAHRVMGAIDLDPASSDKANETVCASVYFTAVDDGLSRQWAGRVWMNPPYAAELVGKFCSKLVQHFMDGDVNEAIVLVNNATETNWFQLLLSQASAVCFPRQRVRFLDPDGNPGAPLQGQAILYLGNNPSKFQEVATFGKVLFGR